MIVVFLVNYYKQLLSTQGMNNVKPLILKDTVHVYHTLFCTLYVNFVA